jgi:hypothetical protein
MQASEGCRSSVDCSERLAIAGRKFRSRRSARMPGSKIVTDAQCLTKAAFAVPFLRRAAGAQIVCSLWLASHEKIRPACAV